MKKRDLPYRFATKLLALLIVLAGCAIPGRPYVVAPAISGTIRDGQNPVAGVGLRLTIIHRESFELYGRQEVALSPHGEFDFPPVELIVAGHEHSKVYRAFLFLDPGSEERVVWRGEFSRRAIAEEIELDCELRRPVAHGQPCRVKNALLHPWLIEAGEETFRRLCTQCHRPDAAQEAVIDSESSSTPAPPDLTKIARRHGGRFDRDAVSEFIEGRSLPAAHGSRIMPIWGERLSAEYERYAEGDELIGATLDPLLAYLESIQSSAASDR